MQDLDTESKTRASFDPIGLQHWIQALCCAPLHESIAQHVSIESLSLITSQKKAASTTSTLYSTGSFEDKKRIQTPLQGRPHDFWYISIPQCQQRGGFCVAVQQPNKKKHMKLILTCRHILHWPYHTYTLILIVYWALLTSAVLAIGHKEKTKTW